MPKSMPMPTSVKVNKGAGETPPPAEIKPPEQQSSATNAPAPEEEGSKQDDFGYETPLAEKSPEKTGAPAKTGDSKKENPVETPEEIKDPATGYGEEPPIVEEPPPPVPAVDPAALDDMDKALEGVPKEDAAEMKAFAVENKIAADVLKKWGDKVKANVEKQKLAIADREKQLEQEKNRTRRAWHDELKADPVFGGDKFDRSVSQAEKVLAEFMPQTKKALTERKTMLPPYVMRDLAVMADHLYATEKLTQGEPIVAQTEEVEDDSPLKFYE